MVTLLQAHSSVPDPHGDRAYADSRFIPVDGDVVSKERISDKPGDTSRQTNVLVDDPDLVLSVEANARYALQSSLNVDGDSTGGMQLTFVVPEGTTGAWTPRVSGRNSVSAGRVAFGITTQVSVTSAGLIVPPTGSLQVGNTAGSIVLRWAQTTTGATPLNIRMGSWIRLMRTA